MASDEPRRSSRTTSAHAIGEDGDLSASEQNVTATTFGTRSLAHKPNSDEPVIDKSADDTLVTEASGERMAESPSDKADLPGVMMADDPPR